MPLCDIHFWKLTGGIYTLSVHLIIGDHLWWYVAQYFYLLSNLGHPCSVVHHSQ
jgi:hypothetical protein